MDGIKQNQDTEAALEIINLIAGTKPINEPPAWAGMSEQYNQQIRDLAFYFLGRMVTMPELQVTPEQRQTGADSLGGEWKTVVNETFSFWLNEREYDLSYSQMNLAFWWAVDVQAAQKANGLFQDGEQR